MRDPFVCLQVTWTFLTRRDVLVQVLGWIQYGSLECRRESGPVCLSYLFGRTLRMSDSLRTFGLGWRYIYICSDGDFWH